MQGGLGLGWGKMTELGARRRANRTNWTLRHLPLAPKPFTELNAFSAATHSLQRAYEGFGACTHCLLALAVRLG